MGVEPKIGVWKTPKWMVKIMEPPIKYGIIWGFLPLFLETPIWRVSSKPPNPGETPIFRSSDRYHLWRLCFRTCFLGTNMQPCISFHKGKRSDQLHQPLPKVCCENGWHFRILLSKMHTTFSTSKLIATSSGHEKMLTFQQCSLVGQ